MSNNTVNGFDSIQKALELVNTASSSNNAATSTTAPVVNPQNTQVSEDAFQNMMNLMSRLYGGGQANATNTTAPTQDTPQQPTAAPKKKKKKRGFFKRLVGGIGKAFKKVGGFLKKALPILSTVAMFVPGIGTAIGGALKIASAAMGAIDAIKNKNPLGFLGSVASAFTGGASGLLGKAQNFLGNSGLGNLVTRGVDLFNKGKEWLSNTGVGNLVTRGIDLFNKGKEWLSNTTAGLGGKVTDWLTNKGPAFLKDYAGKIGGGVTNWLNDKVSNLFSRVTNNPFVQKATDFFNSGAGKFLLDLFSKKV
jgi:hypothetical protein